MAVDSDGEGRGGKQPIRSFVSFVTFFAGTGMLFLGTNPDFIIDENRTLTVDLPEFGPVTLDQHNLASIAILIALGLGVVSYFAAPNTTRR